jgi:photosystem II stability/assembly factor-like uncharacterized protein
MKISQEILLISSAALLGCTGMERSSLEWIPTGGPRAQNVAAILVDERQPGRVFSALRNGDIYISGDNGKDWNRLSTITPWSRVYQLVQDPENGETLYAATETGLYRTRDLGKTWSLLPRGDGSSPSCRVITIDPWKSSTLYLGTRREGIYKTPDGGVTWEARNNGGESDLAGAEVFDLKVDPGKPDAVVAALGGIGIVRSTDAGTTWGRLTADFSSLSPTTTQVVIHPRNGATLVYATDAGRIVRTTNEGETWSISKRDQEGWRVLTLSTDPGNPQNLFAGTEGGILRSTDFGSSWSNLPVGVPGISASLAVGGTGGRTRLFAFAAGLGVMFSADLGETWTRADADLGGSTVSLVTTDPGGKNVYAATGRALLRFDPESGAWMAATSGLFGESITSVAFDSDNPDILYATTTDGAFKSVNRGSDWVPVARNVRMLPRFIETHPSIKTRMIASGLQGAFVSTDHGNSWFQAKPAGNKMEFRSLTFTPRNAGIIHAATMAEGVVVTDNGGLSWQPSRYGLTSDSILAVTIDDTEGPAYFAWTPGGDCFRSTNKGLEWTRYLPPWNTGVRLLIAFDRLQPRSVVALVDGRDLYYSGTGGSSWVRVLENGPQQDVLSMHWNVRSGILYVGTRERGVSFFNLGPVIGEMQDN